MKKEEIIEKGLATAQDIDIIENVMIQTVTTQMSFSSMMNGLERGDYITPGFQRMFRWTEGQVEELAVSLVRGMPIPPIYCYRNREQQVVILDGQQRTLSLYFYFIGKVMRRQRNAFIDFRKAVNSEVGFRQYLEKCGLKEKKFYMKYRESDGNEKIADITYQNLSPRLRRKIDFAPITLVEINVDSEEYKERTLHKIFANLNIGGTTLSSQELRNGIYSCKFYDMLYEINDNSKKWRFLYSGNQNAEVNKASKDVELLLRMCTFKYYVKGNGTEFTLTKYKGKIAVLLDDFSEIAKNFDDDQIEEYKDALLSFFDSVEEVSGRNKDLALVSLFVAWDRMRSKIFISKEKCEAIVKSDEYRSTILSGTSGRIEIEKRLRSVYEQLSDYDK